MFSCQRMLVAAGGQRERGLRQAHCRQRLQSAFSSAALARQLGRALRAAAQHAA
jgi:hypothetical protein